MNTPYVFRPQQMSSPLFPWNMNMNMNAYYAPRVPQPSPAQANHQATTRMSAHLTYYTDSESMQTRYTPHSTWSQINPSDYNHSQPQSEAFQQLYNVNENQFGQPYNHISRAPTYISTSGTQTGSLRNPGSLHPSQTMESKGSKSHITNSINSFEEDRVSDGGPPSTKKRRRQFGPEDREQTRNVRRMGSCERCRIMKLKVSFPVFLLPCQLCLRSLSAMNKPPAAVNAKRCSAKLGLTMSRAFVRI